MPIACIHPTILAGTLITSVGIASTARADLYRITAYEKAACTSDAIRLCSHTYPDERQLLGCMKANRSALTSSCTVAFNSGLKRRHLE